MKATQAPRPHPVPYRTRRDSQIQELRPRNHAVLSPGDVVESVGRSGVPP
jgi:hypothetical protein